MKRSEIRSSKLQTSLLIIEAGDEDNTSATAAASWWPCAVNIERRAIRKIC